MKYIAISMVILCAGCTSAAPSYDFDWRHGEVVGTVGAVPYVFEGDEITFNLYEHGNSRWAGEHELHIESDEIEYKLRYIF